jgi:hypothetical protein
MIHPADLTMRMRLRGLMNAFRHPAFVVQHTSTPLCQTSKLHAQVRHPRNGSYVFGLAFDALLPSPVKTYDIGARLRFRLRGERTDFEQCCGFNPGMYFDGPLESGFFFLWYEVPEEVDRAVDLELEVIRPAAPEMYATWTGRWFIKLDPSL